MKGKTLNEWLVLDIGEVYVFDVDVSVCVGKFVKSLVRGLILRLQKLEHSACGSRRALKLGDDARNFVERFCVLRGIGQYAGERADRKCTHAGKDIAFDDKIYAENADHNIYDVIDKSCAGVDHCRIESGVLSPLFEVAVYKCKSVFCSFFISEYFDDTLIRQHFGDKSRKFSALFCLHCKHIVTAFCDEVGNKQRKGSEAYHDKRDNPVVPKHKSQCADNCHYTAEKLGETLNQSVRNLVDVGADSRHNIAVRIGIDVRERNVVELCVCA